ncbi:MAG TPA: hypothetical protein VLK58_02135 [Conexibacter sp.]|nr:hypothetical protein [Conexibacter sp.]
MLLLLGGEAADATVRPDPYSIVSPDAGSITTSGAMGRSSCSLASPGGALTSLLGGATGPITRGFTNGCSGTVVRGYFLWPVNVTIQRGNVTVRADHLITNFVGGECLYSATLTGTVANGSSSFTVSNVAVPLTRRLSGVCDTSLEIRFTFSTAATITW